MGETDRLLTILTIERGLIRVIAPGARKHKSRLGGRSSQFVVNELFVIQGKQLDKLVQAETVRSFPGLSSDLAKLTASQYLAELALYQALSEQPQGELFALLVEHLQRLEQAEGNGILACLAQGIFHLLALAGVAPEVRQCSITQVKLTPDFTQPDWRVGFSPPSGGIVDLAHVGQTPNFSSARISSGRYSIREGDRSSRTSGRLTDQAKTTLITAPELTLLQQLGTSELLVSQPTDGLGSNADAVRLLWKRIELLLRQYAQYQFDRPIRSAALIDACFPVAAPAK